MYIKACTILRLKNFVKLALSYQLSILLKKPTVYGLPWAISIEPINLCNLKCPECPTGTGLLTRSKGMVSVSEFHQWVIQVSPTGWFVNLYFQGEPFMHPQFFELVSIAKKERLITATSTNAHYLTDTVAKRTVLSGLDIIIISFDGITQDVYEKYRVNGDIEKVFSGVKNLVKAKRESGLSTPVIVGQFLAFKHNEHQIKSYKKLAFEMGVDKVEVKTAQIYDPASKMHLIPSDTKLSRYKKDEKSNEVTLKGEIKNRCWKHWSSCVVSWNGSVIPCCFDKDGDYEFGSLKSKDLKKVWINEKSIAFRQLIFSNQEAIKACSNCPLSRK